MHFISLGPTVDFHGQQGREVRLYNLVCALNVCYCHAARLSLPVRVAGDLDTDSGVIHPNGDGSGGGDDEKRCSDERCR